VLEHCTEAVSGWQTLAPLSVTEAAVASLNNLRAALEQKPIEYYGHDGKQRIRIDPETGDVGIGS
jgi:hypothetical protein